MAWSDPKTWTADDLLTASDLNQYVSDNLSALYNLMQGGGRKNLLQNGAMQVHQRGTSVAGITTPAYQTADRWVPYVEGLGTWTNTIEDDAPTGSGFRKSFKVLCTTADASPAAADSFAVLQFVEGQDLQSIKKGTASAEPLTLSFWVKSNKTGTYVAKLVDTDNSRHVAATYTIASSGTWEQKTITFPADLTGAFDNDNALSMHVQFVLGSGSNYTSGTLATTWATNTAANSAVGQTNLAADTNNYWQVTGVQLEVGSASTGFEHKSYGTELAECQRYYYRLDPQQSLSPIGVGTAVSTTAAHVMINFPVLMRTSPGLYNDTSGTASDYALLLGSTTSLTAVPQIQHRNTAGANLAAVVSSGLTTGMAYLLVFSGTNGYLGFSADI